MSDHRHPFLAASTVTLIRLVVARALEHASADQAMAIMTGLRAEAAHIDRLLADPRHEWNSVIVRPDAQEAHQ